MFSSANPVRLRAITIMVVAVLMSALSYAYFGGGSGGTPSVRPVSRTPTQGPDPVTNPNPPGG